MSDEKDEKNELEKIEAQGSNPNDLEILAPRYPSLAGQLNAGSYGYGYGYGQEDDNHRLRDLLRIVRRRKWLILTLVFIITTLVTIEMYRTKSTYESSTLIEIGKDTNVSMRPGDLAVNEEYDPFYQVNIKTKILFLKSPALLEQVVVNQKLYENPKFLNSGGKKSISEALQTIFARFKQNEEPKVETVNLVPQEDISPDDHEKLFPYVGVILGGLNVEQIKDTRAIKVSFTHNDPKIARQVTAGIADAFLESNFERKAGKFKQTAHWLDESAAKLKAQAERAEQDLANYARTHNIYNTEGNNTLATEKLTRLHDQWLKAQQETLLKRSLYEEVKAGRVRDLPEAFADMVFKSAPRLQGLQVQLAELEKKRASLSTKYGPEYPDVIENNEQIAAVKAQIAENTRLLERQLQADYERAVAEEATIKKQLDAAKIEAVQQNQDAADYNIKKQEVATNRKLYDDFMQKSNQANLQVQEQQNNLRIIQAAQLPLGPSGPNRFRAILLGFVLSLGAGIGLALLLEYLDNTVKTVEDVMRYAQLPALGIIPATLGAGSRKTIAKGKGASNGNGKLQLASSGTLPRSAQLMALDHRSSAAEAYRVLRTSVLLSTAGQPPKLILVTSGQPGEGKTTTAANTAISLAQLGASVLIVDCDLRRPAMHKVFGLDSSIGLSTYLSRDVALDRVIQKLPVDNLHFMPSGSIPPNPAELISSERMREMLATLAKTYDHILIDSPPLINVTDPVILSTMVDGVMLVVHGGKSTRDVVRRARQELAAVGAKVFGVVLNNVDLKRDGYSDYYYYRYSSGYGAANDGD
ncbi:MAG: polysaccharide biosynthesis tyrosine autokinase [Acidobacteriota bacterium]